MEEEVHSSPQLENNSSSNDAMPSSDVLRLLEEDSGRGGRLRDADWKAPGDDDCDTPSGIGFGLPVLEQVLLAIIDADGPKVDRKKRLNTAMMALVGRPAKDLPLPPHPKTGTVDQDWKDLKAVLWMAEEWGKRPASNNASQSKSPHKMSWVLRLLSGRPSYMQSDRSLSERAAEKFFPSVDKNYERSTVKRLASIFSGDSVKKKKWWSKSDNINARWTFYYRATLHDYVRESVDSKAVHEICEKLSAAGIAVMPPD